MSELDDKLNETFKLVIAGHLSIRDAIGISKQAFTGDGYIHVSATQETQAAIANTILGNKVMTGQEWYDRFHKSFETLIREGDPDDAKYTLDDITYLDDFSANNILDIAKRAAGLTE